MKFSGSKTCRPLSSRVNFSSPPPKQAHAADLTGLALPPDVGHRLDCELFDHRIALDGEGWTVIAWQRGQRKHGLPAVPETFHDPIVNEEAGVKACAWVEDLGLPAAFQGLGGRIVIEGESNFLKIGQSIVIPAHSANFVNPNGRFKMIQTVIKSGYE